MGLPGLGDPVAADRLGGAAPERDLDRDCRVAARGGVPALGDQRGRAGRRGAGWLEGLALHPGGHLLAGRAVRLHPTRQHLLRPGLGAGADPGLLRRLRDHPGRGLPGGQPLLVAGADPWDPAGPVGVLGVGFRPGVCAGPADVSDLVLGRFPGPVPGLLPDLFGLHRPPRRTGGRRRARRHEPRLTTGPSSTPPAHNPTNRHRAAGGTPWASAVGRAPSRDRGRRRRHRHLLDGAVPGARAGGDGLRPAAGRGRTGSRRPA